MSELMSASEARSKVEAMQTEHGREVMKMVKGKVEHAIADGKREVSVDVAVRDHDSVEGWLKGLGYKINCGDSQRDGAWFNIKW